MNQPLASNGKVYFTDDLFFKMFILKFNSHQWFQYFDFCSLIQAVTYNGKDMFRYLGLSFQ